MENVKKKDKKRPPFPRWLKLSLYKNCFGENEGNHLGLRFRSRYFCITHSGGSGILIPKAALKMREISNKIEYLKECKVIPQVLHTTNMYIREDFIIQAILSSTLNK